jgi:hypothetical protein
VKKTAGIVALLMLSGCISQVTLVSEDSKRYIVNVDQMAKKLSTTIDGVAYTGTAVGSDTLAVGSTQTLGLHPTSSISTIVVPGANGQALLISANGDYIQCSYAKQGTTLIGKCQSNKGRNFVMTTM